MEVEQTSTNQQEMEVQQTTTNQQEMEPDVTGNVKTKKKTSTDNQVGKPWILYEPIISAYLHAIFVL